jgi:hypothetical protein
VEVGYFSFFSCLGSVFGVGLGSTPLKTVGICAHAADDYIQRSHCKRYIDYMFKSKAQC